MRQNNRLWDNNLHAYSTLSTAHTHPLYESSFPNENDLNKHAHLHNLCFICIATRFEFTTHNNAIKHIIGVGKIVSAHTQSGGAATISSTRMKDQQQFLVAKQIRYLARLNLNRYAKRIHNVLKPRTN